MRREGWEARVAAVIEAARARPFAWGKHDCFSFACEVVLALTGEDRFAPWAGRYASKVAAVRIAPRIVHDYAGFVSEALGAPQVDPRLARVGDVVLVPAPGMDALGVCAGREVAVLYEGGLGFVPRRAGRIAWRIG